MSSNLSSQELLASVDALLAVIDAPDEDGVVFEREDNPYDLADEDRHPWCGAEEVDEWPAKTKEHKERLVLVVTSVVSLVLLAAVVTWISYEVYTLGALIGLILWALVSAV